MTQPQELLQSHWIQETFDDEPSQTIWFTSFGGVIVARLDLSNGRWIGKIFSPVKDASPIQLGHFFSREAGKECIREILPYIFPSI